MKNLELIKDCESAITHDWSENNVHIYVWNVEPLYNRLMKRVKAVKELMKDHKADDCLALIWSKRPKALVDDAINYGRSYGDDMRLTLKERNLIAANMLYLELKDMEH